MDGEGKEIGIIGLTNCPNCFTVLSQRTRDQIKSGNGGRLVVCGCGHILVPQAANQKAPPLPPKLARRVAMSEQHREDEEAVRRHYDYDNLGMVGPGVPVPSIKDLDRSAERTANQMVLAEREACANAICYLCAAGVPMDFYRQYHLPHLSEGVKQWGPRSDEDLEPLPCEAAAIHARGLV